MAKMIVVVALAVLYGEGRKKIAEHGDRIKLPESDALRLKDLGLAKFADNAEPADDGPPKKQKGKEKNGAGSGATGTDNGTGGGTGTNGDTGTGDSTGTGKDVGAGAGDGTGNGSTA